MSSILLLYVSKGNLKIPLVITRKHGKIYKTYMVHKLAQQKHILLAEDDQSISEVITIILQDAQYTVSVPKNYTHLLQLIKEKRFDVVLLDVVLWGENGSDLCKKIKADTALMQTPVILITARSDASNIAKNVGADDVLEKPFDVDDLVNKVAKFTSNL